MKKKQGIRKMSDEETSRLTGYDRIGQEYINKLWDSDADFISSAQTPEYLDPKNWTLENRHQIGRYLSFQRLIA